MTDGFWGAPHKKTEPHIVCIGGGTGLSTMLRGLKRYTSNITAIVSVADDGGGSGVLREELGMPPPGDIRACTLALSNVEPILTQLFDYRFQDGSLKGQSFGNLFIAAMNGISDSFDEAVQRVSSVLAITGRVMPVTGEDVKLIAHFEDGGQVEGESKIFAAKRQRGCRISTVTMRPEAPEALPECIDAIRRADVIILGPGSLYTSTIPCLLAKGVPEAIMESRAVKLYIMNLMTQIGETEGYTAGDHIRALFQHGGGKLVDYCIANDLPLHPDLLERYYEEGGRQIFTDPDELEPFDVKVRLAPLAARGRGFVRHDTGLLAAEIMRVYEKVRGL